jgi:hypothetical protein
LLHRENSFNNHARRLMLRARAANRNSVWLFQHFDSLPERLYAFFNISFTTRQGLVSVMRSSWPLCW